MPTLTKRDIMAEIREGFGFTKIDSRNFINIVLACMTDTLSKGEDVKISGFGRFKVRSKRQRKGWNFQKGGKVTIKRRKVVTFKASKMLKEAVNKGKR